MGSQTLQNFFDSNQKQVKPIELIESKNKSSLVQQLWFARAKKILKQIDHLHGLFEFFEFCTIIAQRFSEYLKQPHGNKYELRSFLERYQSLQPSYDFWQNENKVEVEIFIEKFEVEATGLEGKFLQHISTNKEGIDYGKWMVLGCVTLVQVDLSKASDCDPSISDPSPSKSETDEEGESPFCQSVTWRIS